MSHLSLFFMRRTEGLTTYGACSQLHSAMDGRMDGGQWNGWVADESQWNGWVADEIQWNGWVADESQWNGWMIDEIQWNKWSVNHYLTELKILN